MKRNWIRYSLLSVLASLLMLVPVLAAPNDADPSGFRKSVIRITDSLGITTGGVYTTPSTPTLATVLGAGASTPGTGDPITVVGADFIEFGANGPYLYKSFANVLELYASSRVWLNASTYLGDNVIEFGPDAGDGTTTCTFRAGAGSPEGSVTAKVGSLYLRNDGSSGTAAYFKESGSGNTGWTAASFGGFPSNITVANVTTDDYVSMSSGRLVVYDGILSSRVEGTVLVAGAGSASVPGVQIRESNTGLWSSYSGVVNVTTGGQDFVTFSYANRTALGAKNNTAIGWVIHNSLPNLDPGSGAASLYFMPLSTTSTEQLGLYSGVYGHGASDSLHFGGLSLCSVHSDVATTSGATVTATNLIPAGVKVVGVTVRVVTAVTTSSATNTFAVGDGSDADNWGTGIAGTLGTTTTNASATANPEGTWSSSARSVILDAAGAETFTAGEVRITVHYLNPIPSNTATD